MFANYDWTTAAVLFCLYPWESLVVGSDGGQSRPNFGDVYSTSGVLRLPYAEIVEPFDAHYDAVNGRSRIDFYKGLTKTAHRAATASDSYPDIDDFEDFGQTVKVFFMTTETVLNRETCLMTNGSRDDPIDIQGIIPDISEFEYAGEEVWEDVKCTRWRRVEMIGGKQNKYTFWANRATDAPVHYEMMGYDTLLSSHYDKYELDYHTYRNHSGLGSLDDSLFDIAKGMKCMTNDESGPQHVHLHSPMKEFVENHQDHLHEAFEMFKRRHGVSYRDDDGGAEHETRKNVFRHNHRYVHSFNRAARGYQLAVNRFADRTEDELSSGRFRKGRRPRTVGCDGPGGAGGGPTAFDNRKHVDLIPESMDWRLYGAVNIVKDQAVCGSCWSFAATGTIEGAYFLKTGQMVTLSEQALVDCSWGFGNDGCDGGNEVPAYEWIKKHGGIPTSDAYGPYLGQDGRCHADNVTGEKVSIRGYVNVTSGDVEALKLAIAINGPVAVSFDAHLKDFTFYSNGIYYNKECKNGSRNLDHAVLAVGYGILDGEPYWLIKNSWSTYWGNDGYFLISRRDNHCGVATEPTYVILE